ncbi:hypothetical protein scyTo_0014471 [Scyliorhinus torazame]|uniref:CUB domain-containing protein n=1 Tax=Scyliorhinus torazame TaxID=75743 RepID=A0A401NN35_SCYTO|nr:hypothetical protein [Scyliorhinus torazame]
MARSWAVKLLRIGILVTTCSIWSVETTSRRVYYSCGAIVDSEAQGIILSPGFPASYLPGTHCLWQFFIPAGVRLVLEVFDFDVFENPHNDRTPLGEPSTSVMVGGEISVSGSLDSGDTEQSRESNNLYPQTKESVQDGRIMAFFNETNISNSKAFDGAYSVTQSHKAEGNRVGAQAESAKFEMVKALPLRPDFPVTDRPLDSDKAELNLSDPISDFGDYKDGNVDPRFNNEKQSEEGLEIDHLEVQQVNNTTAVTTIPATKVTPYASPEVCPNDVLYISDLITFSARFCGPNTPVNKTLMFGSSLEMVEVVVELITTTDRGRGFLLLYQFKAGQDADFRSLIKHWDQDNLLHFLVIAGIALLSVVLLTALCCTWRKRARHKGSHSHCLRTGENGVPNSAVDIGEMQLVANGTAREVSTENENNNHSISFEGIGPCYSPPAGNSLHAEMELASSESAMTESGSDEIFVISTGLSLGNLHFSSFKTKGSSNSPTDQYTENKRKVVSDMRLETELEQLYSDSSGSAASYPLTQSGQSQRKVITDTNLRRAWFGSPCFGFRPNSRQHNSSTAACCPNRARQEPDLPCGQGPRCSAESSVSNNIVKRFQTDATKSRHVANGTERITLPKPVFVISEASEDRQPLVQGLDPAGLCGDLGHSEEVKLDQVNRASEQELKRPANGTS